MEIVVDGAGGVDLKPDQIAINFNFKTKAPTYEMALENGSENAKKYCEEICKLGFAEIDFKSDYFHIDELTDTKYNEEDEPYKAIRGGFLYYQSSTLKFDYDVSKLTSLIKATLKFEHAPSLHLNFSVKDDKKALEKALELAYNDAKFKAEAIAKASGLKNLRCLKVDIGDADNTSPFYDDYLNYCLEERKPMLKLFDDNMIESCTPKNKGVWINIHCRFEAE